MNFATTLHSLYFPTASVRLLVTRHCIGAGVGVARRGLRGASAAYQPGLVSTASMHRQLPLIRLDLNGDRRETTMSLDALRNETRLHLREVLQLDQPSLQPRILPRRHCILLTIGHVRAVVFTDRVYLLALSPNAKDYATSLATHLRNIYGARRPPALLAHPSTPSNPHDDSPGLGGTTPHELFERVQQRHQPAEAASDEATAAALRGGFEAHEPPAAPDTFADAETQDALDRAAAAAQYVAGGGTASRPEDATGLELVVLEHALLTVHGRHARRVAYVRTLLGTLLGRVGTAERDDGRLYALFPLANTLTHYEMVSRGLCECIRALLDDERDMREACLTEKARRSRLVNEAVVGASRSQASAYDPSASRGGGGGIDGHLGPLASVPEGADAYLGQTVSPIGSHAQVLRILQSNPHSGDIIGGERVSSAATPLPVSSEARRGLFYDGSGTAAGDEDSNAWRAAVTSSAAAAPPSPKARLVQEDEETVAKTKRRAAPLPAPASAGSNQRSQGGLESAGGGGGSWDDSPVPSVLRIDAEVLSQLELMLESCLHKCTETQTHVLEMSRSLASKQDLLELQGSQARNNILVQSLRISVISASISCGTFLTSVFGMNLLSGAETAPGAFAAVVATSAMLGVTAFLTFDSLAKGGASTAQARRLELMDDILRRLDANILDAKAVLERGAAQAGHLASVDAVVAAGTEDGNAVARRAAPSAFKGLSKAEFRRLFAEQAAGAPGSGRKTPEEVRAARGSPLSYPLSSRSPNAAPLLCCCQVDLLFDLLDANGDG